MTILTMWTVYDHPLDFPDRYVARRFEIHPGVSRPTTDILFCEDLDTLRALLVDRGLICLSRDHTDEPQIVETWI